MELSLYDFLPEEPETSEPIKENIRYLTGQAKPKVQRLAHEQPRADEVISREPESWCTPLRELESRGSNTKVVGGLAGLHEARREHEGQFFTPTAVAALMWSIVGMDKSRASNYYATASL